MNFEEPEVGSYSVWNTTYGTAEMYEEYVAGFLTGGNGAVVGGHRMRDTFSQDKTLVLMELDRRGRDDWRRLHDIEGFLELVKLIPAGDGFWALARQKVGESGARGHEQAWIGMFDSLGMLQGEKVIRDSKADIVPTDIIAAHGDRGFLVSVKLDPEEGGVGGSRVYFLNDKGAVRDQKSFVFGIENVIEGLTRVGVNKYAASGRVRDTHRRWAGWLMMMTDDGGIEWQREYSRGAAATLTHVAEVKNDRLVAGGIARPALKDGDRAGWMLAVEQAGGDVYWQRYYIGDTDYVAQDFVAHPDGLISLLLSVAGDGSEAARTTQEVGYEGAAHTRLVTLSPRGDIFNESTYYNDTGAEPHVMFLGKNRERLIFGSSRVGYTIEPEVEGMEPIIEYSQDFWALAAVATDPYDDPCDNTVSFLP